MPMRVYVLEMLSTHNVGRHVEMVYRNVVMVRGETDLNREEEDDLNFVDIIEG